MFGVFLYATVSNGRQDDRNWYPFSILETRMRPIIYNPGLIQESSSTGEWSLIENDTIAGFGESLEIILRQYKAIRGFEKKLLKRLILLMQVFAGGFPKPPENSTQK
jgi:hypothetical protein